MLFWIVLTLALIQLPFSGLALIVLFANPSPREPVLYGEI